MKEKAPLKVGDKIRFVDGQYPKPTIGVVHSIREDKTLWLELGDGLFSIHPRQVVSRIVKKKKRERVEFECVWENKAGWVVPLNCSNRWADFNQLVGKRTKVSVEILEEK